MLEIHTWMMKVHRKGQKLCQKHVYSWGEEGYLGCRAHGGFWGGRKGLFLDTEGH